MPVHGEENRRRARTHDPQGFLPIVSMIFRYAFPRSVFHWIDRPSRQNPGRFGHILLGVATINAQRVHFHDLAGIIPLRPCIGLTLFQKHVWRPYHPAATRSFRSLSLRASLLIFVEFIIIGSTVGNCRDGSAWRAASPLPITYHRTDRLQMAVWHPAYNWV